MSKRDWIKYVTLGVAIGLTIYGVLIRQWYNRHYYEAPESKCVVYKIAVPSENTFLALNQKEYCQTQEYESPNYNTRSVWAAEDSAFWTMMTAIIGGAGTIIVAFSLIYSAKATKAAFAAAQYAKQAIVADNRAWLSPAITSTPKFSVRETVSGNQIVLVVDADIENTGNSPATAIRFDVEMDIIRGNFSVLQERARVFSADLKQQVGDNAVGEVLFAGGKTLQRQEVSLALSKIDEYVAKLEFKGVMIAIYGCISYRTPHVDGLRQSSFGFYLTRMGSDGEGIMLGPWDGKDWYKNAIFIMRPGVMETD